jgi:hypothetical protein
MGQADTAEHRARRRGWRSALWRRADGAVTEAETRAALRAFDAIGDIEHWLAEQPWERLQGGGGWRVRGQLYSRWRFRVLPVAGGVRVVMCGVGGAPADWVVPAR